MDMSDASKTLVFTVYNALRGAGFIVLKLINSKTMHGHIQQMNIASQGRERDAVFRNVAVTIRMPSSASSSVCKTFTCDETQKIVSNPKTYPTKGIRKGK